VDALVELVKGGGSLIVLRPSRVLATALGLTPTDTVTHPAYVLPLAGNRISGGAPHESIQTHLPADNYDPATLPKGAWEAARLYADSETPASFPAVLGVPLGAGQVVVFTYDLPQAVALIRQGNPALAGWRTVGYGRAYRPNELFAGWLDVRRAHLPQADIHAMLLGNAINAVARAPQPRWWYYPTPDIKSVVVLDSDDDWSAPEHFDALIDSVERHGGHVTVYLMMGPSRKTIATPERVAVWRCGGHSFGIHHNAYDPVYADEEQDAVIVDIVRRDIARFREEYGDVPLSNRNHSLVWKGYVDLARVYAEHGVVMDFNYVSLFQFWQTYLNGSGRPSRFVDTNGEVIDCFQQSTVTFDDASVKSRLAADPLGEAATTRRLLEERVTRSFSPLTMLSHPVSFFTYSSAFMNRVWDAANELGVPIWSAFEWAAFTRDRDQARITDCAHEAGPDEAGRFSCTVVGRSAHGSLTLMLPIDGAALRRATVDDTPVEAITQHAFGWSYALVPVPMDTASDSQHRVMVETGPRT